MNIYFITGTSRGIGKAIAERLLRAGNNKVFGISRSSTINHERYIHLTCDLSDSMQAGAISFDLNEETEKVVLINNAGSISKIKYVGKLMSEDIVKDYMINIVSPAILINNFIKTLEKVDTEKIILNISSGAGKYAVDGWGVYSSSKAALNLYSEVVALEQHIQPGGFKIYAVAPGIVDTRMQDEIREIHTEDFSRVEEFIDYKKKDKLASPDTVAEKLIRVLENTKDYPDTLLSLRDIN